MLCIEFVFQFLAAFEVSVVPATRDSRLLQGGWE